MNIKRSGFHPAAHLDILARCRLTTIPNTTEKELPDHPLALNA